MCVRVCVFLLLALRPNAGYGLLILEVSRSHTTTHHSRQDSSGGVTSSSQRPLPDNTQHSQQTDIHAPDGIRTHDLSRRAAADLRLRPRGHWDRLEDTHVNVPIYLCNLSGFRISGVSLTSIWHFGAKVIKEHSTR